jgi:hypothetical protein
MALAFRFVVVVSCLVVAQAIPQMFVWNGVNKNYGTRVSKAVASFDTDGEVSGELAIEHIVGQDGSSSLEVKGPLDGLNAARAQIKIHEGATCSSEVMYEERCKNCQSYISLKVIPSRMVLTIGGENDVMDKAISIHDTKRGKMLGCSKIVDPNP